MKIILTVITILVTVVTLGTWLATGMHGYTKYQVVEEVEVVGGEDDLFSGTGLFREDEVEKKIEVRDEFHLGLIPTPQGIFDKHIVSVLSLLVPFWLITVFVHGLAYLRSRKSSLSPNGAQGEV